MEPQRPSKAKTVWIIVLIFIVGLSNTAWGLFYFKQINDKSQLSSKVTNLTESVNGLNSEIVSLKKASSMAASNETIQWREIPELGVKYKVTTTTKDLTYAYSSVGGKYAHFSTVALTDIGAKSTNPLDLSNNCSSEQSPGGLIAQHKKGDLVDGPSDKTPIEKAGGKKIGDYYYLFAKPQSSCVENTADQKVQDAAIIAAKAAFESLSAL